MIVFLDGWLLPEEEAKVSIFDRGFLYGDGVFETLRVCRGNPFRWVEHIARLRRGAEFLGLTIPTAEDELHHFAQKLIEQNQMPEALLRITLTRGAGQRGYSPKGARNPSLAMTLHPAPETSGPPPWWRLITASVRLPAGEPLAQFKTCNKLPQILARMEADAAEADEALLLNTNGEVVEGSSSNLFWVREEMIHTPPLAAGILPGVTRTVVLEISRALNLPVKEAGISPEELRAAQGVFLSLSSRGIVGASALDGHPLAQSPLVGKLQERYAAEILAHQPPKEDLR